MKEFNHHDDSRDRGTRGHAMSNESETPSAGTDDTEGHRFVPPEERPLVGDTPEVKTADDDGDDDPDDTEGHKAYARNVGANFDDDPSDGSQDASGTEIGDPDVEDHTAGSSSNDDDDRDDTEGHKIYARNVGVEFD
jgi:hypothetical protein